MASYVVGNSSQKSNSFLLTISASSINTWVDSNIPDYATISSATLTFSAQKSFSAAKGSVEIKVGGTVIADESNKVDSSGWYSPTYNLKSYVQSGNTNAGRISGDIQIYIDGPWSKVTWTVNSIAVNFEWTAHSHSSSEISRTPSTCSTQGSVTTKCSVCGTTQTTSLALDPNNHESLVKLPAVASTCTATGLTEGQKCNACGVVTKAQQTVAMIAHTQVSIPAKSPTCTETGLTEGKKCSVCGTIFVAQQTVAALGHIYEHIKTDPTGSSLGYTTHRCTRAGCGYSYIDSYTCRVSLSCDDTMGTVAGSNIYGVGSTVTITATPKEGYRFVKWSDENTSSTRQITATENVSYTATFEILKFDVVWKNHDGTILQSDTDVPYGTTVSYRGSTPTKDMTAQYEYVFDGWNPGVGPIKSDVVYTAKFSENWRKYTVIWKNEDGTVLETDSTEYGKMPSYDKENPKKPSTAQYSYTFAGWHIEVSEVKGDITYIATYTETINTYTVWWKNEDDGEDEYIEKDIKVPYGDMPEYNGATPTKPPTAEYTYTFAGWDTEIVAVTKDVIYRATYTKTKNKYLVEGTTDIGGIITGTGTYEYGSCVTLVATALPGYRFLKWHDGDTSPRKEIEVKGEVSYLAIFIAQQIYRGNDTFVNPYIGINPNVAVYRGIHKIYG